MESNQSGLWRWLLCGVLLATLPPCGRGPELSEPKIRPVRVFKVEAFGGRQRRSLNGVSRAGQEIPLSFRVPGTIVKLNAGRDTEALRGAQGCARGPEGSLRFDRGAQGKGLRRGQAA